MLFGLFSSRGDSYKFKLEYIQRGCKYIAGNGIFSCLKSAKLVAAWWEWLKASDLLILWTNKPYKLFLSPWWVFFFVSFPLHTCLQTFEKPFPFLRSVSGLWWTWICGMRLSRATILHRWLRTCFPARPWTLSTLCLEYGSPSKRNSWEPWTIWGRSSLIGWRNLRPLSPRRRRFPHHRKGKRRPP